MILSKIDTLNDITVCVNGNPIPGILSVKESCSGTVHRVEAFGENEPVALTLQNKSHAVKLCILGCDGLDVFFGENGFSLEISNGESIVRYLNCTVAELVKGTDDENRLTAAVSITADTKIKDVI